jgi:hypothetical protein
MAREFIKTDGRAFSGGMTCGTETGGRLDDLKNFMVIGADGDPEDPEAIGAINDKKCFRARMAAYEYLENVRMSLWGAA